MADVRIPNIVNEEEWNSFMTRVDLVGKVIRDLASDDRSQNDIAMRKADEILGPRKNLEDIDENQMYVKTNRTVINHAALKKAEEENPNTMSQEAFMRSVELDAQRRSEEKRLAKEVADRHMKHGNKAFRENDYNKALCCYNKAIESLRDSCLLYTNRALTCLKLGLNQRALEDAKTALFLNPNSLKALLYKAEALYHLGDAEESAETISKACELHPNKKDFIKDVQQQWYVQLHKTEM